MKPGAARSRIAGYQPLDLQMTVPFENMTAREAQEYVRRFVAAIPDRVSHLQATIRRSGDEQLVLDYTPESLTGFGRWLDGSIQRRPLTAAEMQEERATLPEWVHSSLKDWTFDETTSFLCLDGGMYFGEVVRRSAPEVLRWDIVRTPKSDINYHRPVLAGFPHRLTLNPVRIVYVAVSKSLGGEEALNSELPRLLRAWLSDLHR
jgi:hypothetical protein